MQTELDPTNESGIVVWARELSNRLHLPTTLVKFLIVGGIGFLINQFMLFLGYDSGLVWFFPDKSHELSLGFLGSPETRLLISSVIAVEVSIICQFNFHERWTFRKRKQEGNIFKRFAKFNLSAIVSPIITVVTVNVLTPQVRDWAGEDSFIGTVAPYLANTVGVMMGFTWNYLLNTLVIWPTQRHDEPTGEVA